MIVYDRIYLIGIGGIGMSALARYFHAKSYKVGGYDKTPTSLTDTLQEEGIEVSFKDDFTPKWIDEVEKTLVVYTPAIPDNHYLINYFKSKNYNLLKRSQTLGLISKDSFTIAVAGTHGKTSTSSVLAHILNSSGLGCTAFLGGIATNYNSNLLLSSNNIIVVEADEYDRSFLQLSPDIAIITSVDADHLDIYEHEQDLKRTFVEFAQQVDSDGLLLLNESIKDEFSEVNGVEKQTYSINNASSNTAFNLRVENHCQLFDAEIYTNESNDKLSLSKMTLSLPGIHNVENALSAIAVAHRLGLNADQISKGINSFKGVKRRFETHCDSDHIYIDDYAHHPEEIKVTIEALRKLYPKKKLTVVFQPHLYSRTNDFHKQFADELSRCDEVILLDIYPARELPIDGVNSNLILNNISSVIDKKLFAKDQLLESLKENKRELLVTLGAGDIDKLIIPIKSIYQ
jgi:UDP-N-acetylmuramate--alanine ligase